MKARSLAPLVASLAVLVACAGSDPAPETPAPEPPRRDGPATPPPAPEGASDFGPAPERAALAPIEIGPADMAKPPRKMPVVKIVAPKPGETIKADKAADYVVKLDVQDWPVEPGGAHVHLVLDNHPYLAVYDPRAAVKLGAIALDASLGEGQHVIVAFPSRETHESVKPDHAKTPLAIAAFTIGKPGKTAWRTSDPTLIYSRPKGTYNGAHADEILVDWYLLNAELGEKKHAIRLTVTPPGGAAKSARVTAWAPLAIRNLPNGETRVKLELLDREGKLVPGPWNSTDRTITVNRDAR